jgi:hypothetical protein
MQGEEFLRVEGLDKWFGDKQVLKVIDLSVKRGDHMVIFRPPDRATVLHIPRLSRERQVDASLSLSLSLSCVVTRTIAYGFVSCALPRGSRCPAEAGQMESSIQIEHPHQGADRGSPPFVRWFLGPAS